MENYVADGVTNLLYISKNIMLFSDIHLSNILSLNKELIYSPYYIY